MPAQVLSGPPGIACLFSDGRRLHRMVEAEPAALVADLLSALAGLVHPHGRVDSPGTLDSYLVGLRDLAAFAAGREMTQGADGLSRVLLGEYWMQADRIREYTTRRMLVALDDAGGGVVLQPGVSALVRGRHFTPKATTSPLVPYTETEWQHMHQVARSVVDEAYAGHRRALGAAARGQDPAGEGGWTADNQRWLLLRLGPCGDRQVGDYLGQEEWWVNQRGGIRAASVELFPTTDVVIAYRLLLGMYCGIVPDGIADLGLGDIDWAGDTTILLSYVKGRTAAESLTLPKRAVRLLQQWLKHSAAIREHAPAGLRDALWLRYSYGGSSQWPATISTSVQSIWARQHGLGSLDRRRIRTTYLSARDRRNWHGSARAAIDPNHTPAVEGDHYLSASTPAQHEAVEVIIEGAQQDMLARARAPVVLSDEAAADLAGRYPQLVTDLHLDHTAIAELVAGAQDVFVAACSDPLSGLHGPVGKPCPARPWVCLLCPLAVFTPRHAPNLLRLKAFFSRQWDQMPSAHFMAVFGPYATRVQQVLDRYDNGVLAAAVNDLGDLHDDEGLPLRPEEISR